MKSLRTIGLKSWIKLIPEFGCILPLKLFILAMIRLLSPAKIIHWTFEKKHDIIENYLLKEGVYPASNDVKSIQPQIEFYNVWVFWWQGENAMPPIIHRCYKRLLDVNRGYSIKLVTKENYADFVSIPDYITKRIEKEITITHFSDVLRANLLYHHGGIWVDATLYFVKRIPKSYFHKNFFSIKDHITSSMSPARHRWTGFFLCAFVRSAHLGIFVECFNLYWSRYDKLIDYLLIDYFLDLIYKNNIEFKDAVDRMGGSDFNVHCMSKLCEKYDQSFCNQIIKENVFIKMSYKNIDENILMNHNTNYKRIIESLECNKNETTC